LEENRIFNILCATGEPKMDVLLSSDKYPNINVLASCKLKSEVLVFTKKYKPEIIMITDKLGGDEAIISMIINLKRRFPYTRIIYLAGGLDPKNTERRDALGALVLSGIYDIVIEKRLNIDVIIDIIENPKKYESVEYLTKGIISAKTEAYSAFAGLEYEDYGELDEIRNISNNIFVFTSIKPGTGKSFVAANAACALARYGKDVNGHEIRVALIEADLQTLSIGTILNIKEDENYNLGTALWAVKSIFNRNNIVADEATIQKVKKKIQNCMQPLPAQPNLHVLSGSMLTPEDIDALQVIPEYYNFIMDVVRDQYDFLIIDLNSSIFHPTTFTLLQAAKNCFYILNLDYNNVRNNLRYKKTIAGFGIQNKIRYIMNQDIGHTMDDELFGAAIEPLIFTTEKIQKQDYFDISVKIPMLPMTVFLNRQFDGNPVVFDNNGERSIDRVRLALMKTASLISPMNEEVDRLEASLNRKKGIFASIKDLLFSSEITNKDTREKESRIAKKKAKQDEKKALSEKRQKAKKAKETNIPVPAESEREADPDDIKISFDE